MQVVPAAATRLPVHVDSSRRKDPLPAPFAGRVGVLSCEGIGQLDVAGTIPNVRIVLESHPAQVLGQGPGELRRNASNPVLLAFSVSNGYFTSRQVDILDPEARAFHQALSRPVHQRRHEPEGAAESTQNGRDLSSGEHHRETQGTPSRGPHPAIHRDLGRGRCGRGTEARRRPGSGLTRSPFARGKARQEQSDLRATHLLGTPLAVEENELPNPCHIGLLSAAAVMPGADRLSDEVEQSGLAGLRLAVRAWRRRIPPPEGPGFCGRLLSK